MRKLKLLHVGTTKTAKYQVKSGFNATPAIVREPAIVGIRSVMDSVPQVMTGFL